MKRLPYFICFLFISFISVKNILAQEFPVGVFADDRVHRANAGTWDTLNLLGINTVIHYLDASTKPFNYKKNIR